MAAPADGVEQPVVRFLLAQERQQVVKGHGCNISLYRRRASENRRTGAKPLTPLAYGRHRGGAQQRGDAEREEGPPPDAAGGVQDSPEQKRRDRGDEESQ